MWQFGWFHLLWCSYKSHFCNVAQKKLPYNRSTLLSVAALGKRGMHVCSSRWCLTGKFLLELRLKFTKKKIRVCLSNSPASLGVPQGPGLRELLSTMPVKATCLLQPACHISSWVVTLKRKGKESEGLSAARTTAAAYIRNAYTSWAAQTILLINRAAAAGLTALTVYLFRGLYVSAL